MSNIVFILGAGASKRAGAPLMAEFLDVAKDLWAKNRVSDAATRFENIFKAIGALQRVHSKSEFDIHNVESVFAALEMGRTLKKFPGCENVEEIDTLIKDMKVLISKTIEQTLAFPIIGSKPTPRELGCPEPYDQFSKLVEHLKKNAYPAKTVSVVTFNYDLAVDFAFYYNDIQIDYYVGESCSKNRVPLLKLHGSLNWARHKESGRVIPWTMNEYLGSRGGVSPFAEGSMIMPVASQFREWSQCQHVDPEPEIVPPTWNKADYHRTLSTVWSQAAKELGEAESIFVIGYSLPESDSFFRYLYALGSVSEIPIQRFWVFNPDKTGGVEKRFRELLGPGARDRYKYVPVTFDGAIGLIERQFPTRT